MEKSLQLYIDNSLGERVGFPSNEEQIEISAFTADYKRMGNAPTITCTVKHPNCLDNDWTYGVYTVFNNERFYLKQIPSSSFSNKDARYIHELELCSERIQLDNVFVFDVVSPNAASDKPVANNTTFSFFGTIAELATRLNYSLVYTKLQKVDEKGVYESGYVVIVDEGITSEGKLVTIENKVFSEVLQEVFHTYEIPYYFVGKEIHIGHAQNELTDVEFKYGASNSLLSIKKQNANAKVINRITGFGSADNLPYFYPNQTSLGDVYIAYNNQKNLAIVGDQNKFSKNKLTNVFVYTNKPKVDYYVGVNEEIKSEEWEQNPPEFYNKLQPYGCLVECSFYADIQDGGQLTIEALSLFGSGADEYVFGDHFYIDVYYKEAVGDDEVLLHDNVFVTYLCDIPNAKTGFYRCEVRLITTSSTGTPKEYWEKYVSFDVHYTDTQVLNAWKLEDKYIDDIADYGISLLVTPKVGDEISFGVESDTRLDSQKKLMPSIYRKTLGQERFYNATNDTYTNPETEEYYTFKNEYVEGNPREHIVEFADIKPTIEGIRNSKESGSQLINSFIEFAYDEKDSNEKDEEGNYIHPYFFAKLRKFDGEHGFSLFHHAIESGEMTISMTSGNCGGCQWVIGVDPDNKLNPVQVYEDYTVDDDGTVHLKGSLKRDENGDVLCGRKGKLPIQSIQQNTINNEVWVALMKDEQTFHTVMPTNRYRPMPDSFDEKGNVVERGDTFVILNINLPQAYITAAEKRLEEEIIRYMAENNDEKFNFSIDFSKVFFAENESILADLNENSVLNIEYNGGTYPLYVSSFSYSIKENNSLPDIKVELTEKIELTSNSLQQAVTQVEVQLSNKLANLDIQKLAAPYFHRKDVSDQTNSSQSFTDGIKIGQNKEYGFNRNGVVTADTFKTKDFQKGFVGASIYKDETGTVAEFDYLNVRKKATFKEVEIQETKHIGGKLELTAAECKCEVVEDIKDAEDNVVAFKVYFRRYSGENEFITNKWQVGDQARCDTFNLEQSSDGTQGNRYYWRLVTAVGTGGDALNNKSMTEYHWIVLSNKAEETITLDGNTIENTLGFDNGSSSPLAGDSIIQLGNRFGTAGRVSAIELAGAGTDSPYIRQYENITSFELGDIDTQIKPGDNKFKGLVSIEDGSYGIGNFTDLPEELHKAVQVGGDNLLRNTGFDGEHQSVEVKPTKGMSKDESLYSENLDFWETTNTVSSVPFDRSHSGFACKLQEIGSSIEQSVTLINNEHYVLSFKCAGLVRVVNISTDDFGGVEDTVHKLDLVGTGEKQDIKFAAIAPDTLIWEVKLERGTIQTDWTPSQQDTDSLSDSFRHLWYLQAALKGKTEILGGLILSSILQLGNYRNGVMEQVTAGISGITSNPALDVAFWGGGTFEQAIKAVNMFKNNPAYQPTEEDVANIAKAVITHGGRAILNDIVLRGYIYALGGVFNGTVYATDGVFKGDVMAKRTIVTTDEEPEYYNLTTGTGTSATVVKFTKVKTAYIKGNGKYYLPTLEEGQMVEIVWFLPQYAMNYQSQSSRFIVEPKGSGEAAVAGIAVLNTEDTTSWDKGRLGFVSDLSIAPTNALYRIIGDRPSGQKAPFTYWSIVEAGSTIKTTGSGISGSINPDYEYPYPPVTDGQIPLT